MTSPVQHLRPDVTEVESRLWSSKAEIEEGKESRVSFVTGLKYVDGTNKSWRSHSRMTTVNKMYCILKELEERVSNGPVTKKLLKLEILIC